MGDIYDINLSVGVDYKGVEQTMDALGRTIMSALKRISQDAGSIGNSLAQKIVSAFPKIQGAVGNLVGTFAAMFSRISEFGKNVEKTFKPVINAFKNITSNIKNALISIHSADKAMSSFGRTSSKSFSSFSKGSNDVSLTEAAINKMHKTLKGGFTVIAKYAIGLRSLFFLYRKLRSATIESMDSLAAYSSSVAKSMDSIRMSISSFKAHLATAFQPLLDTVARVVNTIISYLNAAMDVIGKFFAALTGQGFIWHRATKAANTYAGAIGGVGDRAKEAAKNLAAFDDINILESPDNGDGSGGSGGGGADDPFAGEWEQLAVDEKIQEFADKVREIIEQIFDPLKEAWDAKGEYVMSSWKYALESVWELVKAIGRDLLTVWGQSETVDIFKNILQIVGDIGFVVGNLATNFRLAWQENQVGLHILEGIRDIIGIIVQHITNAADATVKWSASLDFYPILDAILNVITQLKPAVDSLMGILEDFYTKILLPLAKWTIEKGLPELLNIFADLLNKIDWAKIRNNFSVVWDYLQKFGQNLGQGLLDFVRELANNIAKFVNTNPFTTLLQKIAEFLASLSPGEIKSLATAFAALFGAWKILSSLGELVQIMNKMNPWAAILLAVTAAFIGMGNAGNDLNPVIEHLISSFNDLVNNIPWADIGERIGQAFTTVLNMLQTAITTFDWLALGRGVGTAIYNAIQNFDWGSFLALFVNIATSILEFACGAFEGINWFEIPTLIVQAIENFFSTVDWMSLASAILRFLADALGAAIQLLLGLIPAMVKAIVDGISGIFGGIVDLFNGPDKDQVTTAANTMGTDTGQAYIDGLGVADANAAAAQIVTNAETGLIDANGAFTFNETGQATANSYVDGLGTATETAYSAASNLGTSSADGLKESLGSDGTTSSVATDIGNSVVDSYNLPFTTKAPESKAAGTKFITEGGVAGIRESLGLSGEVSTVTQQMGNAAVSSFNKPFEDTTLIKNSTSAFGLASMQALGNSIQLSGTESKTAKEIGQSIPSGVSSGVDSKLKETQTTIEKLGNESKKTFEDSLEISGASSKVFNEHGTTIVESTNEGIDTADQTSSVDAWVENIQSRFTVEKWQEIFQNIITAFETKWTEFNELSTVDIDTWLESIQTKLSLDMWTQVFNNLYDSYTTIWSKFSTTWDSNMNTWWNSKVITWFTVSKWSEQFQHVTQSYTTFWTNFSTTWTSNMNTWWDNNVVPYFTEERWNGQFDHITQVFTNFWNNFSTTWKSNMDNWWTNDVETFFPEDRWTEQFDHVISGYEKKWEEFSTKWTTNMDTWWKEFTTWYDTKWTEFYTKWTTNMDTWWKQAVEPWFQETKWNTFGTAMQNGIYNGFKGILQKIGDVINGLVRVFNSALDNITRSINHLVDQFNSMADELDVSTLPHVSRLPISQVSIPALATGAVIPPNKEFLALLGDQRSGTNIETPLDTMIEAFNAAANEMLNQFRNMAGAGNSTEMTLDGQTFARLEVPYIIDELRRQGYNVTVLESR